MITNEGRIVVQQSYFQSLFSPLLIINFSVLHNDHVFRMKGGRLYVRTCNYLFLDASVSVTFIINYFYLKECNIARLF